MLVKSKIATARYCYSLLDANPGDSSFYDKGITVAEFMHNFRPTELEYHPLDEEDVSLWDDPRLVREDSIKIPESPKGTLTIDFSPIGTSYVSGSFYIAWSDGINITSGGLSAHAGGVYKYPAREASVMVGFDATIDVKIRYLIATVWSNKYKIASSINGQTKTNVGYCGEYSDMTVKFSIELI